jgi:hypothetical protein
MTLSFDEVLLVPVMPNKAGDAVVLPLRFAFQTAPKAWVQELPEPEGASVV